ncbi:TPA: ligand-binding protein SH3 [Patescibacteria group bacterium]|nr:MAG: hypothetical protein VE99_C0001G0481 [candidate division Kazan bacterium GW2011_GWC1_52_13]KKW27144.1 MAG: hypothetical protein VF00_C0001G0079 [candidate division Kazan bacterium GW2011_GWB1_52_7]HCL47421.1 ligand-binding protein SH3 [Patescibacteria group bacterium]HCR42432.1 ligand-binding protein SH3 [Patescibacteria group bacterium]
MLPLVELRGAIPIAIGAYHLSPLLALGLAVVGNLIPIVVLLLLLERVTKWLRALHPSVDKWFAWFFAHTHRRHSAKFERWGSLALMLFVAVPLPMTGAWTGTLLAYLFGIKFHHALVFISTGVLIAGIIVLLASLGGTALLTI